MKNIIFRADGTPTQFTIWVGLALIILAIYFLGGTVVAKLQEGMPPGTK